MERRIQRSIVVEAPAMHVWASLSDYDKFGEWLDGFRGFTRRPRSGAAATGTRTRQEWAFGLPRTHDVEVTESVPGRVHAARSRYWWGEWRLTEEGPATRVTWSLAYRPPGGPAGALADRLWVHDRVAASIENSLLKLKRRAEAHFDAG